MLINHHVPPRRYHEKGTFILRVPKHKEQAYHDLLGFPCSFEEARLILAAKYDQYVQEQLDKQNLFRFKLLFPKRKKYENVEL